MEISLTDKLIIFDTTLRDGEQSPGASMSKEEKVRIAKQLERLGVNIIESTVMGMGRGPGNAKTEIIVEYYKNITKINNEYFYSWSNGIWKINSWQNNF